MRKKSAGNAPTYRQISYLYPTDNRSIHLIPTAYEPSSRHHLARGGHRPRLVAPRIALPTAQQPPSVLPAPAGRTAAGDGAPPARHHDGPTGAASPERPGLPTGNRRRAAPHLQIPRRGLLHRHRGGDPLPDDLEPVVGKHCRRQRGIALPEGNHQPDQCQLARHHGLCHRRRRREEHRPARPLPHLPRTRGGRPGRAPAHPARPLL